MHDKTEMQKKSDAIRLIQIAGLDLIKLLPDASRNKYALFVPEWNDKITYNQGDWARFKDSVYEARSNRPVGEEPTTQANRWVIVATYKEGTPDDPIPYLSNSFALGGRYYSFNGAVYLCKSDMIPCLTPPSETWQWQAV